MPVLSLPASLPYLGHGLRLEAVCLEETGVAVVVTAVRPRAPCPRCHRPSRRVHSRYPRTIADLPCSGAGVTLRLQSRRFRCRHADCPRRIFCERWPGLVAFYARRTDRLRTLLQAVGFALGGRPGAHLLPDLHLRTSRMTLLRLVRAAPLRVAPPPAGAGRGRLGPAARSDLRHRAGGSGAASSR